MEHAYSDIRPQQGTKCVDCGCCPAVVFADGQPICWDCDAGEPCRGKKLPVEKLVHRVPAVHAAPASVVKEPPVPNPVAPPAPKEKPVGLLRTRGTKTRISDEIRKAILAADPSVKHTALAKKFGISDVSVYTIRKTAGISVVRDGAKPGKKAKTQLPKPAVTRASKTLSDPPVNVQAIQDALSHSPTVSIHLTFSPDQLDLIWQKFSVESKAIAITAGLQSHV